MSPLSFSLLWLLCGLSLYLFSVSIQQGRKRLEGYPTSKLIGIGVTFCLFWPFLMLFAALELWKEGKKNVGT